MGKRAFIRSWLLALGTTLAFAMPPAPEADCAGAQPALFAGIEGDPGPGQKKAFNRPMGIAFAEGDPGLDALGFTGKWLVGDLDGLKVVAEVDGAVKSFLLPGSPGAVGAVAVRPPGCPRAHPMPVAFAERLPGKPVLNHLWILTPERRFRRLNQDTGWAPSTAESKGQVFGDIAALAIGQDGSLRVVAKDRRQVLKVSPGGHVTTLARLVPRDTMDLWLSEAAGFRDSPYEKAPLTGLVEDPRTGLLYVSTESRILVVGRDGEVTALLAWQEQEGLEGSRRLAPLGNPCLWGPCGLQLQGDNLVFVERLNQVLRQFNLRTQVMTTLAGGASTALGSPGTLCVNAKGVCLWPLPFGLMRLDLALGGEPPAEPREPGPGSAQAPQPALAAPQEPPSQEPPSQESPPQEPTLWEALLVEVQAYDPEAVRGILARTPLGTPVNEVYGGPAAGWAGATPLMRLIDLGDERNALGLIDLMQRRGESNWNASFAHGPMIGINAFLASLGSECFAVAEKLFTLPEVDTLSAPAFAAEVRKSHPLLRPAVVYAWFSGQVDLANAIIGRNLTDKKLLNQKFDLLNGRTHSVKSFFLDLRALPTFRSHPDFQTTYGLLKSACDLMAHHSEDLSAPSSPSHPLASPPAKPQEQAGLLPPAGDPPGPEAAGRSVPEFVIDAGAELRECLARLLRKDLRVQPLQARLEELQGWLAEFQRNSQGCAELMKRQDSDLAKVREAIRFFEALEGFVRVSQDRLLEIQAVLQEAQVQQLPSQAPPQALAARLQELATELKAIKAEQGERLAKAKAAYQDLGKALAALDKERAAQERQRAAQEQERAAQERERAAREQERTAQEQERTAREQARAAQERERAAREQERTARKQERAAQEQERAARKQEHAAQERERAVQERERAAQERERAARKQEHAAQERERAARKQERAAQEQERAVQDKESANRKALAVPSTPASPGEVPWTTGTLAQLLGLTPPPDRAGPQGVSLVLARQHLGGWARTWLSCYLATVPPLETLDLSYNCLTLADLDPIVIALRNNSRLLKHLNLAGNPLGWDPGSAELAGFLRGHCALRDLNLSSCCLQGALSAHILELIGDNPQLRTLNLSGNAIDDPGGVAIASALKGNRALRHLDLSGNHLTEVAFSELFQAIQEHPGLRTLNLMSNHPQAWDYQARVNQILHGRAKPGPEIAPTCP